ncbi:aspartate/glutamate racemase family protein [Streptomyces sp. RB6PN25]|uniref:Aspartate/glutamate racemase family protein n=1 Tax=Streptomyces humicola TaxID=2953240 RepID=A0ABT1Q3K2_9ACTN|nr:aspartate/glutamate racemase family protein [Streptomyces humicola]MCQ4084474.1 aspartate/glutamate racemase family protein [Streptomyces humicola]
MKIGLIDSSVGLLATAAVLHRLRPDADLVLSCDPDGIPWGPRAPEDITARALACARAAVDHAPDAMVVACNTASVHALAALRAELEPDIPVIGTVPAVKPAAAAGGPVAVWATPATTGSPYQRGLIADFAGGADVTEVPCPGLADAVDAVDDPAIDTAVKAAAALTPPGVRGVVLGCTHYGLVADRIRAAVAPGAVLYGSAEAVAAQALRRLGARPAPAAEPSGSLAVIHSGRPAELPGHVAGYPEGRVLLRMGRSRTGSMLERRPRPRTSPAQSA